MSVGSNPTIPTQFITKMYLSTLLKSNTKNSNFLRSTKLYFDLLKTKHILFFFLGGLKQRQFGRFYHIVKTSQLFLEFLKKIETRLEFTLLKSGVALTGKQAKSLILQGSIIINNCKIITPSFQLKVGDLITLNRVYIKRYKVLLMLNLLKTLNYIKFLKKKKLVKKIPINCIFSYLRFPFFLEINFKTFTICFVRSPIFTEFFFSQNLSLYNLNQLYFLL